MTDWIDEHKQKIAKESEEKALGNKLRAHELDVISVKAPMFWNATVERVASDVGKLKREFAGDDKYGLTYEAKDGGFNLTRHTYPTESLTATLEAKAALVRLSSFTRDSMGSSGSRGNSEMSIRLDTEDNVRFRYRGREYDNPEQLAEAIVKSVAGI